jgi:hypothetical protein
MEKIIIDNIEIKYQDKEKLNKLLKIINNNTFVKELLPKKLNLVTEEENYTYISSIDNYIDELLKTVFEDQELLETINTDVFKSRIYYYYLISKYDKRHCFEDQLLSKGENYFLTLASLIYNDSLTKTINFAKNVDSKEKEELINLLKEDTRLDVLNYLLETFNKFILDLDSDFINKIKEYYNSIINTYLDENYLKEQYKDIDLTSDDKLSHLSLSNLNKYFEMFLEEIDITWLNTYKEAIKNNKIIFEKSSNPITNNASYEYNGVVHMMYNENTYDFSTLAHEFAHYMSHSSPTSSFVLREFPSLFFEIEAANYLEKLGYSKEETTNIKLVRKTYLFNLFLYNSELTHYLIKYNTIGSLKIDDFISVFKNSQTIIDNAFDDLLKDILPETEKIKIKDRAKSFSNSDDKALYEANKLIDSYIIKLISNGPDLLLSNTYLIGSYLTELISQEDVEDKIDKMLYITSNLSNLSVNNVQDLIKNKNKTLYKRNL